MNSRRNRFEMLNRASIYLDQSLRSHFIVFTLQPEVFFKITRLEAQISLVGLISIRLIVSVNDLAANITNVSQSLHQRYYRALACRSVLSMCCRINLQWRPYFLQIAVLGRNFRILSEKMRPCSEIPGTTALLVELSLKARVLLDDDVMAQFRLSCLKIITI